MDTADVSSTTKKRESRLVQDSKLSDSMDPAQKAGNQRMDPTRGISSEVTTRKISRLQYRRLWTGWRRINWQSRAAQQSDKDVT